MTTLLDTTSTVNPTTRHHAVISNVSRVPVRQTAHPTHGTCGLTLLVNGTSYRVRPIPAEVFAAQKAFRLTKPDGTAYDVSLTLYGPECDCPDFIFNRDGIDPAGCKHIKATLACGLFGTSRPDSSPAEPTEGLSLAEQADRQADAYRAWGTETGNLFARTMEELASKIRMTNATTPDQYEGRIEVFDADIRERLEARGYEAGRTACQCGDCPVD